MPFDFSNGQLHFEELRFQFLGNALLLHSAVLFRNGLRDTFGFFPFVLGQTNDLALRGKVLFRILSTLEVAGKIGRY